MLAVFWISVLGISYAYVGYLAVLWLLWRSGMMRGRSGIAEDQYLSSVTLIVSAFNEESVIRQKIENSLSLDYPSDLLEVIVASDGSSDRTCEIVREFADKGVVLRHYEGRVGKTASLNRAVPMAAGNIVLFSDANSTYEKGTLRALLRPFHDGTVGFVTGWTKYGSGGDGAADDALGIYSKLEFLTKQLESRLGSCVGADGAIFAIRKELYRTLQDDDINDLVIPLSINQQGYRGVLQPEAVCFEKNAGSSKGEFRRQVRITTRTIRAIVNYRRLLNPFRFGLLSFEIFSHKLCKLLVPFFLLALLLSSLLLTERSAFYLAAFAAQAIFYLGAAVATRFAMKRGMLSQMVETARTFVVVNVAIALAWIQYFRGETYTTWSPTQR